jgi:hypothetical protein
MNGRTSMRFTVGTVLRHAQETGMPVRVLVEGQWIDGVPVGSDDLGVVLEAHGSQSLVRLDAISAVTLTRPTDAFVAEAPGADVVREGYPTPRRAQEVEVLAASV